MRRAARACDRTDLSQSFRLPFPFPSPAAAAPSPFFSSWFLPFFFKFYFHSMDRCPPFARGHRPLTQSPVTHARTCVRFRLLFLLRTECLVGGEVKRTRPGLHVRDASAAARRRAVRRRSPRACLGAVGVDGRASMSPCRSLPARPATVVVGTLDHTGAGRVRAHST